MKPPGFGVAKGLRTAEYTDAFSVSRSPASELTRTSGSAASSGLPVSAEPATRFSLTLKAQGDDVMDGALFTWPTATLAVAVVVRTNELPWGAPESLSESVSE